MMEKEGDVDDFIDLTRKAVLYMGFVGLFPELHPLFLWYNKVRGVRHAGTAIVSIARASIEQGLKGEDGDANAAKSDPFHSKLVGMLRSGKISNIEATDSIASNIAAGSDTTAITLSAAFYYLYRNPEILAKLRAEVDKRSDPVTFEASQTMPYLQAVINETLRMHPAVGYVLRREVPAGGSVLAGRHFPGGVGRHGDAVPRCWMKHAKLS
jgi:cytochrome P450